MSLLTHLATIDDPRRDINKKHELLDSLLLTVSGVMSGAEGWKDIKEFGDEKLDWLRQYRPFANGIPVDDTIARVACAGPGAVQPGVYLLGERGAGGAGPGADCVGWEDPEALS